MQNVRLSFFRPDDATLPLQYVVICENIQLYHYGQSSETLPCVMVQVSVHLLTDVRGF